MELIADYWSSMVLEPLCGTLWTRPAVSVDCPLPLELPVRTNVGNVSSNFCSTHDKRTFSMRLIHKSLWHGICFDYWLWIFSIVSVGCPVNMHLIYKRWFMPKSWAILQHIIRTVASVCVCVLVCRYVCWRICVFSSVNVRHKEHRVFRQYPPINPAPLCSLPNHTNMLFSTLSISIGRTHHRLLLLDYIVYLQYIYNHRKHMEAIDY